MGYGALGILSGGVAGGAKAVGEVAESRIKSSLDDKKTSALEKKQMNMQRLSQEFQKNERTSGQEFDVEQEGSRRKYEEDVTERGIIQEEKTYRRRKDESDKEYKRRQEEEEKTYQRRIEEKRDLPVDAEKNYNFIIDVLKIPEADARAMMTKSYTDTKSGMKKRELYASIYTDLKKAAAEMGTEITPNIDKEMKDTAANISGFRPEIGEDDRSSTLTDYIKRIGDLSKRKETPDLEPSHEPFTPVPGDMVPSHEPEGILSGGAEPTGAELPADPKTWEIQFIGQGEDKPFVMVGQEMRMLTPEEYARYKKETGRVAAGKSLLESVGAKTEI